jgi:hypothetical protein
MNPYDAVRGALAVLDEVGGNYCAALVLAEAAIDHNVKSDSEFQWRLDIYQILSEQRVPGAERGYLC